LTGIGTKPKFAIGQRALLVQASKGNVLWDCVSLIADAPIEGIKALGGISSRQRNPRISHLRSKSADAQSLNKGNRLEI
jgi:hypothetical protein